MSIHQKQDRKFHEIYLMNYIIFEASEQNDSTLPFELQIVREILQFTL